GPVQINQGALLVYDSRALGTTNGATTVANGTQLVLAAAITVPETLVLSGLLSSFGGTNTLTGPITLVGANTAVEVNLGAPLTINAVISGGGGFSNGAIRSSDVLTLNSNNTYTGTTTLSAGTVRINGSQPGSPIVLSGGTVTGTGTVGTITASGSGAKMLSPGGSPGILNSSNVTLD